MCLAPCRPFSRAVPCVWAVLSSSEARGAAGRPVDCSRFPGSWAGRQGLERVPPGCVTTRVSAAADDTVICLGITRHCHLTASLSLFLFFSSGMSALKNYIIFIIFFCFTASLNIPNNPVEQTSFLLLYRRRT